MDIQCCLGALLYAKLKDCCMLELKQVIKQYRPNCNKSITSSIDVLEIYYLFSKNGKLK